MKKKYFMSMLSILMMAMLCVNLVSCSKDDDGDKISNTDFVDKDGGGSNDSKSNVYSDNDALEAIYQTVANYGGISKDLIDTKWRLVKKVKQYPSYSPFYGKSETSYDNNGVLTFSKDVSEGEEGEIYLLKFKLYLDGTYVGTWGEAWWKDSGDSDGLILLWDTGDSSLDEEYEDAYGCVAHKASVLQNGNLSLKTIGIDGSYKNWIYSFVSRGELNSKMQSEANKGNKDNDDEDGNASPRIGFYDFTATKTSITVRYQIFNKDEANISSARVYYGTSSNPTSSVSATVTGVYITATISGLSKGTEYYIKCKATGSGGSTTTDVTKCITNY